MLHSNEEYGFEQIHYYVLSKYFILEEIMGLITGYICLILLLLLLALFISQKFHLKKMNAFLMKIHKFAAYGFIGVAALHFLFVLEVLDTRSVIVNISGIVMIVVGILLTVVYHTMKNRKKQMKLHHLFSLVIAVALLFHIVFYFIDFFNYLSALNEIEIHEVNLDEIEDGDYIGEYDVGYIYVKVKVTVSDHTITNIELLEHNHERGIRAESIVNTIVAEQKIDVDTVSGATNSSRVIKMACENALKQ